MRLEFLQRKTSPFKMVRIEATSLALMHTMK